MKFVKMKKELIFVLLCLLSSLVAKAGDYKYVRTYDANGNVVATANYDEYISATVNDIPTMMGSMRMLTWGVYAKYGDDWNWTPAPNYGYNSQNNGWYIFVCTIGYHSEYFYYKADGSCVRTTFMAGGNGRYKEYVAAKRPTIDRTGPTR